MSGPLPPRLLELSGLAIAGAAGRQRRGPDLTVDRGECVVLHGDLDSGVGAVLRAAIGLEAPLAGRVRLFGSDPAGLDQPQDCALRARLGWMPRRGALISNLSLFENLVLPLRWHRRAHGAPLRARAAEVLAWFGVTELPALNPGQAGAVLCRRVALARAVILDPDLLVLEDPSDDLDPATTASILAVLRRLATERGTGILLATYAADLSRSFGDRCVAMPSPENP